MRENKEIDVGLMVIDEEAEKRNFEKFTNFYFLLDFWMKLMEKGISISSYFEERKYSNIVIYGNGAIGKHLQTQLRNDGKDILYIIERNVIYYMNKKYELKKDINKLPRPDVIVVTPIMEYSSIKAELKKNVDTEIVSIEEIILSL